MWEQAAERFKQGPPSDGGDAFYETVKAELRKEYGRDAVDKRRLKALACTGGLHDEHAAAFALLPALKQRLDQAQERSVAAADALGPLVAENEALRAELGDAERARQREVAAAAGLREQVAALVAAQARMAEAHRRLAAQVEELVLVGSSPRRPEASCTQ